MTFFPVGDEIAFSAAAMRAGNAAMGLWARAGSYTVQPQLTNGHVPAEVAAVLGTPEEIAALVREGFWRPERGKRGGYVFVDYNGPTRETEARRKAGQNARARRSRTGKGHTDVTRDAAPDVTRDSDVTLGHSHAHNQSHAAAAAKRAGRAQPPPGPGPGAGGTPDPDPLGLPASPSALVAVDILASAAAAAGLVVRWDTLTGDEVTEVEALIDVHGDQALVKAALASRAAHATPPASARAWLGTWRALPQPGARCLVAVPEQRCPEHDTEPARTCRSCAADRKAGNA